MNLYRIKLLESEQFESADYYVIAKSKAAAIKEVNKELVGDFCRIGSAKLLYNKVLKGSGLLRNPYLKEDKRASDYRWRKKK